MVFRARFMVCVAVLTVAMPGVWACDIPVYQYALENWTPDSYQAFVFLGSGTEGAVQTALDQLGRAGQDGAKGNLELSTVDVDAPMTALESALWEAQSPKNPVLPWLVVRNPLSLPPRISVWSGPLTPTVAEGLIDSPARQTMAGKLKSGALGVWLLLACGDAEKDEKALATLRAGLREADTRTVERLGSARASDAPAMADCIVRIARADETEAFLVQSLLGTEPDLHAYDEPMVFPVYGRGRVLYALVGPGIRRDTLVETALFLAGECSCEVKDGNPGVDLLMGVDWGKTAPAAPASGYCEVPLPALGLAR